MKRQIAMMMRKEAAGNRLWGFLVSLIIGAFLLSALPADALEIEVAMAKTDRHPGNSKQLGFDKGTVLQVGAFVDPGNDEVDKAIATNLDTGVVLELTDLTHIFPGYYEASPNPQFDPEQHLGVWEITIIGESGATDSAKTQELHLVETFPYVRGVKAEGDALAPLISWKPPKDHKVPDECFLLYEVRLLTDIDNQFFVSDFLFETSIQIDEGTIPEELLEDTWVRTIAWCYDLTEYLSHPVPFEAKSSRFHHFLELLGEYDDD